MNDAMIVNTWKYFVEKAGIPLLSARHVTLLLECLDDNCGLMEKYCSELEKEVFSVYHQVKQDAYTMEELQGFGAQILKAATDTLEKVKQVELEGGEIEESVAVVDELTEFVNIMATFTEA